MNTVADKLMKLVQTKSDIRQALLDKGFNVPDTMPFSGYADLIRRFPCNAKDFPDIPGMIARWSAKGLTNEDMSTNPVWKDLMGNGYDLQMKNFGWAGMSGVNGYVENFNQWFVGFDESNKTVSDSSMKLVLLESDSQKVIYDKTAHQIGYTYNFYIKVTGIEGRTLNVKSGTLGNIIMSITEDGIYSINTTISDDWGNNMLYLIFPPSSSSNTVTIEQLPLYPDAIVFDGVDDYGICENFPILTKEKGYTVVALRQWITTPNDNLFYGLMTNGNSRTDGAFVFEDFNGDSKSSFSFGGYTTVESGTLSMPFTYQTSTSYNGKAINIGSLEKGVNIFYVGRMGSRSYYVNAAVWEICILDHDATEEELQKIQDYYKQEYPWLFPDQAWTVTGKTNEDTDRATIANTTGNGNNLVLSNFGFAENSGYGLYGANYSGSRWFINSSITATKKADSFKITSISQVAVQLQYIAEPSQSPYAVPSYTIRVTGLTDGQTVNYRVSGGISYPITQDGVYTLPGFDFAGMGSWYGFQFNKVQESCDVTIEQIPEYEGYLVTDGVDDSGRAVNVTTEKDFTLVGEWKLFSDTSNNAGLSIHPQIHIFNRPESIQIMFRSAGKTLPVKSLKAICSDGRCYDKDWNELHINVGNFTNNTGTLFVGSNGGNYTKTAFKNLSLYNNQIFSKEDCIKAYNYLQTLKS